MHCVDCGKKQEISEFWEIIKERRSGRNDRISCGMPAILQILVRILHHSKYYIVIGNDTCKISQAKLEDFKGIKDGGKK